GAFHQRHPGAVNRILVVTVVELELVSDRPDLEGCRNQQRRCECDLPDHEKSRDDVDQPTAIATATFFHHLSCIAVNTDYCRDEARNDRSDQGYPNSECEDPRVDRKSNPVGQVEPSWQRVHGAGQQVDAPIGYENSNDCSEYCDHETFGQHMPD